MARPTLYTPELLQAIAARLATGEPLAVICRDEGMPDDGTVRAWGRRDDEIGYNVTDVIARARECGFDAIAARARKTARGLAEDKGGDSSGDVQRDKLIIDTDLKLLAKWDRKRYGEHQQIDHGVTGTLEQLVVQATQAALPAPPAAAAANTEGEDE